MRLFREYSFCGADFFLEKLEVASAVGRKKIRELTVATDAPAIAARLEVAEKFFRFMMNQQGLFVKLRHEISRCKDIHATLERLGNDEILDDIELFEVKELAFLANDLRKILADDLQEYRPQEMDCIISVLDPENSNVPSFYIYDAYSRELSELRAKRRTTDYEDSAADQLRIEEIEQDVRENLSRCISLHVDSLFDVLEKIAVIDLETAKALMAQSLQLCKPVVGSTGLKLRGAFNAEVKAGLEACGREFQPVDIELFSGVAVLTGANMSGKSVLLKLVAMAQLLFQAGFFVPAESAEMQPVSEIFLLCGDLQSSSSGLSSYAAEMLYADMVVKYVKSGKALVLFDELARSTNPHEGRAIVAAIAEIMAEAKSIVLITTHYSAVNAAVRRLRVKGIRDVSIPAGVDIYKLGEYIDYAIVDDDSGQCPEEALRIAELIGVSPEIIEKAKKQL